MVVFSMHGVARSEKISETECKSKEWISCKQFELF